MYIPSKSLFRKYFIQEKCRQWEIHKQMSKLTKSFHFLQSENPAAIGGRLEEGYIPKPNDANVLATIADKLNSLLKKVEKLLDEIKSHDQSLFEFNGLTLKKKWQRFHHTCNESFITSLSQIELEINTILAKVEEASTRFNM